MSVVTNVMLTGLHAGAVAPHLVSVANAGSDENGGLNNVEEKAGGSKAMETTVYLGAFNFLDVNAFVAAYREARASMKARFEYQREGIQLFLQRQDDTTFMLIDPSANVDYHYRDATKDKQIICETIDLTPEGVKKDPERVMRAMRAQADATAAFANMSVQFFEQYGPDLYGARNHLPEGIEDELNELDRMRVTLGVAQDELLKAVAGI